MAVTKTKQQTTHGSDAPAALTATSIATAAVDSIGSPAGTAYDDL